MAEAFSQEEAQTKTKEPLCVCVCVWGCVGGCVCGGVCVCVCEWTVCVIQNGFGRFSGTDLFVG